MQSWQIEVCRQETLILQQKEKRKNPNWLNDNVNLGIIEFLSFWFFLIFFSYITSADFI